MSLNLAADGQFIAEGVTDALDNVTSLIRMMEGGDLFEFTAFVRFGEFNSFFYECISIICMSHQIATYMYFNLSYSSDGCLPENTTVQSSTVITWPEVGITDIASVECPCGTVSHNRITTIDLLHVYKD